MSGQPLDLRTGIYRHYKGPLYEVSGYAHDANDDTRTLVLYRGLELDGAHLGPRWSVRNAFEGDDPFFSWLHEDGTPCTTFVISDEAICYERRGPVRRRFTYLGPVLTAEMLTRPDTEV